MALEVYFKSDVKNAADGAWAAFCAGRPAVEDETDRRVALAFESALFAVALSLGVAWKGEEVGES